jgi:predicted sulfurtransferase
LIVNRLQELEISKRQINHPNIYLSNKGIKANFESEQQDIEKIMRFFAAYPEQLEAAKSQLIRPDMAHTKFAINELTALFTFISNDLNDHLKTTNTYEKYQSTYINTQLAIKDYIAFLNSKLLNEEVD